MAQALSLAPPVPDSTRCRWESRAARAAPAGLRLGLLCLLVAAPAAALCQSTATLSGSSERVSPATPTAKPTAKPMPLGTPPSPPKAAVPWKKLYTKEGITGYRRFVPGSGLAAWRGSGIIEGSIYRVAAVYMDSDRSCEWLADCVVNKLIEKKSLETQLSYNVTHLPWPFQDRDFVFSDEFIFNSKTKRIMDIIRPLTHPKYPPQKGRVRGVFMHDSTFKAYAIDPTHTWVEASIHVDPKGLLPDWLVNMTSRNWPLDTFRRLRLAVKHAKGFEPLEAKIRAAYPGLDVPRQPDAVPTRSAPSEKQTKPASNPAALPHAPPLAAEPE